MIAIELSSERHFTSGTLASRLLRPLGRISQQLGSLRDTVTPSRTPLRMASTSPSPRDIKADEILAAVETATHEPMTVEDVRRARAAESGTAPLGLNGETEANPAKLHFKQAQKNGGEEDKEPLPKLSAREEKEWNVMAEKMEYFHAHFRMEFERIYQVSESSDCRMRR